MGSRTFAEVVPTPTDMAFNAFNFGYGGHSLVTPHVALKRLWWTENRIQAKVDRAFVLKSLLPEERRFLLETVGFGAKELGSNDNHAELVEDDLTDSTYMEWILTRARRFFLILAEAGVPDQIFGIIDLNWDDSNLPLARDVVPELDLTTSGKEDTNERFYNAQFTYLLRELEHGEHIDYNEHENIPLEHVDKVPPAACLQEYAGRVHLPGKPNEVFMRRKFELKESQATERHLRTFRNDVLEAKANLHPHIAPIWASYTCNDAGFIISDFVAEHTIGTFIHHREPPSFMRLPPAQRPILLLNWMLCLSDALTALHKKGKAHTTICPSNVWVNKDNYIAFADIGQLKSFQRTKRITRSELYEYAAPESPVAKSFNASCSTSILSRPSSRNGDALSIVRQVSIGKVPTRSSSLKTDARGDTSSAGSTSSVRSRDSLRSSTDVVMADNPTTTQFPFTPSSTANNKYRNFSRQFIKPPPIPETPDGQHRVSDASSFSARASTNGSGLSHSIEQRVEASAVTPEMSDIFSLACIYLNILTFLLDGKLDNLTKLRTYSLNSFKQRRRRQDSSFHANPEAIAQWMQHLEDACNSRATASAIAAGRVGFGGIWTGVHEILDLVRSMLNLDALKRPAASEVRSALEDILYDDCGIRQWQCKTCDRKGTSNRARDIGILAIEADLASAEDEGESESPLALQVQNPQLYSPMEELPTSSPEVVNAENKHGIRRMSLTGILQSHGSPFVTPLASPNPFARLELERPSTSASLYANESDRDGSPYVSHLTTKLERMQVLTNPTVLKSARNKKRSSGLKSLRQVFTRPMSTTMTTSV